jgi:serine/threonine protein kinase
MIVMRLMCKGSLRSNLTIIKYIDEKYTGLSIAAAALSILHKCNLAHGDFHSGNILLDDDCSTHISDFGLSRPVNQTNLNEIYGIIPYIAPEVLRGKPYTKAADIYSFGIIMWELTSGVPAFNDRSHDFILSLEICEGLRPKIVEGTSPIYKRLMKKCWDSDPNKRPTANELSEIFSFWVSYYNDYPIKRLYERKTIPSK